MTAPQNSMTKNIPPPPFFVVVVGSGFKIPDPQHCEQSPLFTLLVGAGLARRDSGLEPQQAEDESAAPIL